MGCERCGRCCHDFGMYVADDDDIARLFAYHGFETIETPDGIYVKGSNPCAHLSMDGGVAECLIYDERPGVCRKYLCEKASKGMELTRDLLLEYRAKHLSDMHALEGAVQQLDLLIARLDEEDEEVDLGLDDSCAEDDQE